MTAKELVKAHGLAGCVDRIDQLTPEQLRGLAKIADDYGKAAFRQQFMAALQARRAAERKSPVVTPGSMLEALQAVGGVAAPYAWYSLTRHGQVVMHTWRSPQDGRMDAWHLDGGRWTFDSRISPPNAAWKALPQYTALLRALDAQAPLHRNVVLAAISTDISGGIGPAKRLKGSNVLLVNSDGTPARFEVSFDVTGRWHRLQLMDGQDCDVGAA